MQFIIFEKELLQKNSISQQQQTPGKNNFNNFQQKNGKREISYNSKERGYVTFLKVKGKSLLRQILEGFIYLLKTETETVTHSQVPEIGSEDSCWHCGAGYYLWWWWVVRVRVYWVEPRGEVKWVNKVISTRKIHSLPLSRSFS